MALPFTTNRPATYEDLLRAPDALVAELLNGELHTTPRPSGPHTVAASVLGFAIGPPFHWGSGGPGGWWILDEPELHLDGNVVVPDLAGWKRERMLAPPADHIFSVSPDWVCEVASPRTERVDRVKKLPIYAHAGVSHAWVVNPTARTLEVLQRQDDRWLVLATYGDDAIVRAVPFEAVEIDLLTLWGETRSGGA